MWRGRLFDGEVGGPEDHRLVRKFGQMRPPGIEAVRMRRKARREVRTEAAAFARVERMIVKIVD
jgi:hypothetical protein